MLKEFFYTTKTQDDAIGPATALDISEALRVGKIDKGDRIYVNGEWKKLAEHIEKIVIQSADPVTLTQEETHDERFIYYANGSNYGPVGWNTYRSLFKKGIVAKDTPIFLISSANIQWLFPSDHAWDEHILQPIESEKVVEPEPVAQPIQVPPKKDFQGGKWALIVFASLMVIGFISNLEYSGPTTQTQNKTKPTISQSDQTATLNAPDFTSGIYYQSAGKAKGPVSAFGLLALIKDSKVGLQTLVGSPGGKEWQSLQSRAYDFVRQLLVETSSNGLQGEHHFFITFDTSFKNIEIPKGYSNSSNRMTITLQNWFRDLRVTKNGFYVVLNFKDTATQVFIPFGAIKEFSDPHSGYSIEFE